MRRKLTMADLNARIEAQESAIADTLQEIEDDLSKVKALIDERGRGSQEET